MKYPDIALEIIRLKNNDLAHRDKLIKSGKLGEGYDVKMEEIHINNAKILDSIIDNIGFPSIDKVGDEANDAAWLIIQHSISVPAFMKKCLELLKKEDLKINSHMRQLAYLSDRIAILEDGLQMYGTQFDWDKNNQMNPQPYDDIQKVNSRRKSIGLNTLEEQLEIMQSRTKKENEVPMEDFHIRKERYNAWRRKVGWIN